MSFSLNQTPVTSNGSPINFSSAVAAGDFLYIIMGDYNVFSGSPTGTFNSVSDNINGSWTILDNSGPVSPYSGLYLTGAIAYLANSQAAAAGAMTITVNSTSLQSPNYIAVDLSGAATSSAIVGHSMNSNLTPTSNNFTTPSVTDTNAGDWVIGWSSAWTNYGSFTAGAGATIDGQVGSNGGQAGSLHVSAESVIGSNSVNASCNSNVGIVAGTVIISNLPPSNAAAAPWMS